ncbi:MAG: IS1595 family transposase [Chloroflexota bacterium]
MSVFEFENIVKTEGRARRYLLRLAWKNYRRFCIRCRNAKVYRLSDGRLRCPRCGYTFQEFAGRWLSRLSISCRQWLWLLKLFELELSARKIAGQLEISYPTALKAVTVIRAAIVAGGCPSDELLEGHVEMDESYFGGRRKGKRGRGAGGKVPVFGILERDGIVRVEAVRDVSAETLLGLTVKTVRRGSIVYTDRFKSYDSLMFCGYRHLSIDHKKHFASGKVYINGVEGFWSFAKERLIKHHGVSKEKFPLYLKEMEFRYNHRKQELFPLLARFLVALVPEAPCPEGHCTKRRTASRPSPSGASQP